MDEYLESIQSMESAGTSVQEQDVPDSTPILEMSGDAPKLTFADPSSVSEEISQDLIPYLAPQKVIVRRFRLRK
jgi:hypothetical protein